MNILKKPIVVALLVAALVVVALFFASDNQEFQKFSARRDAWFAKCEAYRQAPLKTSPEARVCEAELNVLMVEARQHGWVK